MAGRPVDLARRGRLAAALALFSCGVFVVAALGQASTHNHAAALVDAFGAVVTAGSLVVLRRTGRVGLIVHSVLAMVFFGVVGLAVTVRGAGLSGATLMLLVMPLFATLIIGPRMGAVWLAVSLLGGLTIGGLGLAGAIVGRLPKDVQLINDHVVLVVFTVLLFGVAVIYERRKDEALRQIAALEAQRHLAELGELRERANAQLAHAEQYAALGRVAAAAAHEINNPLAYLIANLNYLQGALTSSGDPDLPAALRESLDGAQKIHGIVSAMGTTAASRTSRPTSVLASDAIATALAVAEPRLAARARIKTTLAEAPAVIANETALIEVIVNLLLDAAASIPEGEAGQHEIAVELSHRGDRVVLEIREPCADAPGRSQFKGLGLAVILAEAVVRSFGGTLAVDAALGKTVVRLSLVPAADSGLERAASG